MSACFALKSSIIIPNSAQALAYKQCDTIQDFDTLSAYLGKRAGALAAFAQVSLSLFPAPE
jgi:hypothetical protein